ncbi:carbohydrate ABC transporter permease [Clostridium omnivorum]|uniref:ABC transporter permease n=1 Tax=Clostridium omnivorum TaxID=1604902 RepID=A0ABQ5N7M9_9CLOT|nr:carbohydrate ABC transporter permease [Clostridium sp. E14]GLC31263.1 ABC transporter permease [Clostridium sp. E14]
MSEYKLFDNKSKGFKVFFILSMLVVGLFVLFPLYWIIITALKPATEAFNVNPSFFPKHITFENFKQVITDKRILTYLKNSLFVSFTSSFITTVLCIYAGYSFSKFRYRGRNSFMLLVMTAQMFPFAVLLLTIYTVMRRLNLLDNYISLILSFVTFTLPMGTLTLKSYFDEIPDSLIESGSIDGASRFTIMHKIIFPLVVPGVISTAIYGFVWSWNDLLYSLTLVTSASKRTLAPGLSLTYMGEFQNNWSNMMAASIFVSIPVALIFIFLQRYFIQGITSGSVKG